MSLTGRVPLLLLAGLAAVAVRPVSSTAWLWAAAVLVVTTVDLALAPSPRRLVIDRSGPTPTRQGVATVTELLVRNPGSRTLRGVVRDAWQPTAGTASNRHPLRLRGGETARLRTALTPLRRGVLRAHLVTVRARGPLGLACRQRSVAVPGALQVLPRFDSRKHLPSRLAALRDLDGRSAVLTRGQGTEFDSLREYVPGDDVRSIDWRATGRSRAPVVRTWQPERDRRVVIVLDTSRTSAARVGDEPRLDAAIEAVLLLSALAARAGDLVDVVAGDTRVRAQVRAAGRHGAHSELMGTLATVHPVLVEADWARLAGTVAGLTRRRALVVLLTALERAPVEQGLLPALPALAQRHQVVVASVRDPSLAVMARTRRTASQVYAAAAAERAEADRAYSADLLRVVGADVVDADPEELPVALSDHYLALKARGLL